MPRRPHRETSKPHTQTYCRRVRWRTPRGCRSCHKCRSWGRHGPPWRWGPCKRPQAIREAGMDACASNGVGSWRFQLPTPAQARRSDALFDGHLVNLGHMHSKPAHRHDALVAFWALEVPSLLVISEHLLIGEFAIAVEAPDLLLALLLLAPHRNGRVSERSLERKYSAAGRTTPCKRSKRSPVAWWREAQCELFIRAEIVLHPQQIITLR